MDKWEFLRACEEYADGKPYINDEHFAVVEYVYNWHPSISVLRGEDQIAMLYCMFGMNVIYDMYPRSKKMQILDDELQKAKAKVEEIENNINAMLYRGYSRSKKMQILDDELQKAKAKVEEIENNINDEINA